MLFLLITLKMVLAETIMINENQMLPEDCDNISLSDETGKYFFFTLFNKFININQLIKEISPECKSHILAKFFSKLTEKEMKKERFLKAIKNIDDSTSRQFDRKRKAKHFFIGK